MFKKNKQEQGRRGVPILQNRQQSYHYSAKRSDADKIFGRREPSAGGEDPSEKDIYRRHKQYVVGVLLLLIIIGGYFSTLTSKVVVSTIANSEFAAERNMIQAEADRLVGGSLLNRSKLTLNENKLEEDMRKKFPGISRADISTSVFGRNIKLALLFSKPAILLTNSTNLYIVSENGTILMDITKTKPSFDTTKLPLVQDQTGVELAVNKPALTQLQAAFIREVKYQTEQKGLSVETMILSPGGGQLDVRYGGLPYYVKFNLFEDARKSSGTFIALKEELDGKKIVPAEYVDVRIPERAYVK